jgi:sodium/proline symporter
MRAPELVTFAVYLAAMMGIGVYFYYRTQSLSDYILGGRKLGPTVAALSAGASDMSGWLLLGLPGALYASGMASAWIAIGLALGAYLNWQFVAGRLRTYTEVAADSLTLPDYLENRFEDGSRLLRVISAVVILVFFTIYTSSGLVAGATLFQSSFDLDYNVALLIGVVVIMSYTFLGGFMAVSWTDFFQGSLMLVALLVVPVFVIEHVGGWGITVAHAAQAEGASVDIFAGMTGLGIASLMAWGLGYFGQPHILARFMAIERVEDVPKARLVGMSWMVLGLYGAIFTGFAGIGYFADSPLANRETVFIELTQALFNPWISGILLAAILSAIMSTIDSQLLVCSSALAEDFYKSLFRRRASQRELVWIGRASVVGVALVATLLALDPDSLVLELVAYAWAGFGAAFGPVILLSLFWRRMTRNGALAGILTGAVTVIVWKNLGADVSPLFEIYEILPGFVLATLAAVVTSLLGRPPAESVTALFDSM